MKIVLICILAVLVSCSVSKPRIEAHLRLPSPDLVVMGIAHDEGACPVGYWLQGRFYALAAIATSKSGAMYSEVYADDWRGIPMSAACPDTQVLASWTASYKTWPNGFTLIGTDGYPTAAIFGHVNLKPCSAHCAVGLDESPLGPKEGK